MTLTDLRKEALRGALSTPNLGDIVERAEQYFQFLKKDWSTWDWDHYRNGYIATGHYSSGTDPIATYPTPMSNGILTVSDNMEQILKNGFTINASNIPNVDSDRS